jgi:hypothetical protein
MSDYLIEDPRAQNAYLVNGAEDLDEAIAAAQDHEPQRRTSEASMRTYATDVTETPELLDSRAYPLGQPVVIEL